MANVKVPRPNSDVRLRKWPPGRVAQLKLFLGHLEQAVGVSLAAQVEQSPKRKFSQFVPKIVEQDITVDVSFREIRVSFEVPRGLKNLLFYEYQISATEGFFNFDQFNSPETFYYWPQLQDGTTYYLRIRVVTKDGEVGPWSNVLSATTPIAQTYGLYDGTEFVNRVTTGSSSFYPWQVVFERPYTAIGGKAYYAIDYDVQVARHWGAGRESGNVEWADVEFKWMEQIEDGDFVQKGRTFNVTTYNSANVESMSNSGFYTFSVHTQGFEQNFLEGVSDDYLAVNRLKIPGTWENPRRGTFVQKFSEMQAGGYTIRLEARVIPDHTGFVNDFESDIRASIIPIMFGPDVFVFSSSMTPFTEFTYGSDVIVKLKNFNIFEALED